MALFPELGPQYYDEKHKEILGRMEAFYAESITMNQSFWGEADTDTRFMMGDQSVYNDMYGNLPANRRRSFNFNRIRRVVNMISGHQRRNRKSTIVVPVENGDSETSDQFTKILLWLNQHEQVLETISEAFEGALVTGMNLLHVWVDYRSDPVSGNIKVDNCSYNSFLIDPFFKKADLSDCNAIWKRSYLTKRECISLMPAYAEEILSLQPNETGSRDSKFQFMPESYNYSMRNLMTYDEFWYRDYRKQKLLVDTKTGETMEWKGQDEEALKAFIQKYPSVTVIESEVPTVKVAVVIQGKVLYDGPNPMGIDKYPFVPVFAYYTPQSPYFPWRVQGVVRNLRDPQYLYNRRKIIELDILESQINSGWKYKEDALVNPKDVFLSRQGCGLALKAEALMTDVEQILPPQIPPSMIQLSEILAKEVQEISGVNEELLGSAIDDKAGILSMLRQGASLTTLQGLFDNLDRAQKLLGQLEIDIVQVNFTPGKVQKILENQQPTPQFYNKAFGKYGAAVEDGLNTTTQRQMQMAQLLQLKEAGVPVPSDLLLESSTLQNKKQLVEAVKAAEQGQAKMAQDQAQMQMAQLQAQLQLTQAQAHAAIGMGEERISRIQENKALAVERRAAAIKDQDMGLLNLVKALKEVDRIDLEDIEKLLTLEAMVKEKQAVRDDLSQPVQEDEPQSNSLAV
jgi:hypothetical protein